MTTDNTDMTSALDQDQAQLDATQEGLQPQVEDSTTGELRALRETVERQNEMVKRQNEMIENQNKQVAGLQSKVDRGLNGMREQYETSARQSEELAIQQYLANADFTEQQKADFQALAQQNLQLKYGQNQNQPQEEIQETAPPPTNTAQDQWDQIYAIPRSMGIDPQTEGIDYAAFTDPGLTEEQRRNRFFASLGKVNSNGATPATPAQQTQQPVSEVQNPPQGGTPANGASNNLRSQQQIHDAYLNNKLSTEEYRKRLAEIG